MGRNNFFMDDMSYYFRYNKTPVLSKEEERDLMVLAANGDKKAKDKLILGNMRFAYYMAKKYKNCGMEFIDLLDECVYGLVKAVDSIDLKFNNRFTTYARFWIMNSVNHALNLCGNSMRLPEHDFRLMKKVRSEYSRVKNDSDGDEDYCQSIVANNLGISVEKVGDLLMVSQNTKSFEQPDCNISYSEDDTKKGYEDYLKDEKNLSPEDEFCKTAVKEDIFSVINKLSDTEYKVLLMHYGLDGSEPMSFSEIGNIFGYTKSWANFTDKKAKSILRKNYPQLEMYIA